MMFSGFASHFHLEKRHLAARTRKNFTHPAALANTNSTRSGLWVAGNPHIR